MTTLRVVKSSVSSGTSHIVGGTAVDEKLATMCGTEIKRSKNTSVTTFGQVTCVACVQGWQREHS